MQLEILSQALEHLDRREDRLATVGKRAVDVEHEMFEP
jgi:hypothetical protein